MNSVNCAGVSVSKITGTVPVSLNAARSGSDKAARQRLEN
jgi:hypothetical protein